MQRTNFVLATSKGVSQWRIEAEAGQEHSQHVLAHLLQDGVLNVTPDPVEAEAWYRKAALKRPGAKNDLGIILADRGDDVEAATVFEEAIAAGHVGAHVNLGEMYETGRGVTQDKAEAHALYSTAAESGHPMAAGKRDALVLTAAEQRRAAVRRVARRRL